MKREIILENELTNHKGSILLPECGGISSLLILSYQIFSPYNTLVFLFFSEIKLRGQDTQRDEENVLH